MLGIVRLSKCALCERRRESQVWVLLKAAEPPPGVSMPWCSSWHPDNTFFSCSQVLVTLPTTTGRPVFGLCKRESTWGEQKPTHPFGSWLSMISSFFPKFQKWAHALLSQTQFLPDPYARNCNTGLTLSISFFLSSHFCPLFVPPRLVAEIQFLWQHSFHDFSWVFFRLPGVCLALSFWLFTGRSFHHTHSVMKRE